MSMNHEKEIGCLSNLDKLCIGFALGDCLVAEDLVADNNFCHHNTFTREVCKAIATCFETHLRVDLINVVKILSDRGRTEYASVLADCLEVAQCALTRQGELVMLDQ